MPPLCQGWHLGACAGNAVQEPSQMKPIKYFKKVETMGLAYNRHENIPQFRCLESLSEVA